MNSLVRIECRRQHFGVQSVDLLFLKLLKFLLLTTLFFLKLFLPNVSTSSSNQWILCSFVTLLAIAQCQDDFGMGDAGGGLGGLGDGGGLGGGLGDLGGGGGGLGRGLGDLGGGGLGGGLGGLDQLGGGGGGQQGFGGQGFNGFGGGNQGGGGLGGLGGLGNLFGGQGGGLGNGLGGLGGGGQQGGLGMFFNCLIWLTGVHNELRERAFQND